MNNQSILFDDLLLFEMEDLEPSAQDLQDAIGDLLNQDTQTYDPQASIQANQDMHQDDSFMETSFFDIGMHDVEE